MTKGTIIAGALANILFLTALFQAAHDWDFYHNIPFILAGVAWYIWAQIARVYEDKSKVCPKCKEPKAQ